MSATAAAAGPTSPTGAQARVLALERQVAQLQQTQASFATRINQELSGNANRIQSLEQTLREREEEFKTLVDKLTAQTASELATVVAGARSEFDTQRPQMQSIATAVGAEFDKVKTQMDGSGKDGKWGKGFLPIKE